MLEDVKYTIANSHLVSTTRKEREVSIAQVDVKADELVAAYANPNFKSWYCMVIYELGVERTEAIQERASRGRFPARLFSKLAKEAIKTKRNGR